MQYVSFIFALDYSNMCNKALILKIVLASQCFPLFFLCFKKKHPLLLHTFFVLSNEPQYAQRPSGSHVPRKIHGCSQPIACPALWLLSILIHLITGGHACDWPSLLGLPPGYLVGQLRTANHCLQRDRELRLLITQQCPTCFVLWTAAFR